MTDEFAKFLNGGYKGIAQIRKNFINETMNFNMNIYLFDYQE